MTATVLAVSALALLLFMAALWTLSLRLSDVSIVDPGWGLGFVLVAWIAFALGDGSDDRRLLLAVLVSIWGLRLAGHLVRRKLVERREDPRYGAMRERHGDRFALVSLGTVFLLQGGLIWIVSLPVQASASQPDGLQVLDWAGVAVWFVGLGFEVVGDEQLRRFKADPANEGGVLDRGLWQFTRHPNYFGDLLVWWGLYLAAVACGAWWTITGPLVMTALLIHISGKRLLESHMSERAGYADYVARTSGFIPLPPRAHRARRHLR